MGHARFGIVVLGLLIALAPVAAFADDDNQAAIDALKAEKASLLTLTSSQQGVVIGQKEIANARAIGQLLAYDDHAQTYMPNSLQQYREFCAAAVDRAQANVANAAAMLQARPWDQHAADELANANASMQLLWTMIGDSLPGNPYANSTVQSPTEQPSWYGDEPSVTAAEVDAAMLLGEDVIGGDGEVDLSEN